MALDYKSSLGRYRRYLQVMQSRPMWSQSLWTIFSLGLLIVLVWFALRPTLITITELVSQVRQNKELSQRMSSKIQQVQTATSLLEDQRGELSLLSEGIPNEPEWLGLVTSLQRAVGGTSVDLNRLSINNVVLKGQQVSAVAGVPVAVKTLMPEGINGVSFEVAATGDYEQLIKLVDDIENIRRVVLLSEVKFERDKETQLLGVNIKGQGGFLGQ